MLVRADHAGKPPLFAENWLSAARCAQAGRPSLVSGAAGCCWSRARSRRVWRRAFSARSGSLTSVVHAIPSSAAGCRLRSPEIRERQFSRYVAILTRKTKRAGCMAGVGVSRVGRRSSQDLPRQLADVPARDRVATAAHRSGESRRIVLTGPGACGPAASAARAAPAPCPPIRYVVTARSARRVVLQRGLFSTPQPSRSVPPRRGISRIIRSGLNIDDPQVR